MSETEPKSGASMACVCTEDSTTEESSLSINCECPRDDHDIVIHEQTCLLYKSEKMVYPHDPVCECEYPAFEDGVCLCCSCPVNQCRCHKAGREAFDEWRSKRDIGAMPAVLESTHPLMQKFQETLKQFLIKENAIAEEEILNLREELKLSKQEYDKDLESIYRSDHDTNAQRVLIEEYEATLAQRTMEREAAERRAKESNEKYKKAKAKLEEDLTRERETTEEMEALNALCQQLSAWRDETESDLTVSQRMSDKMRMEKQALAAEKRQLDIYLFSLSNEVWKLESKLEMFKKQLEIKNTEMEKVNDRVTAYAAELEDLELDKRRLVSLWNSVIVNITQRDKVYDSVRDDYKTLQDNYRTLLNSLDITKKVVMEEMNKGKEIAMNRDKLNYDIEHAMKLQEYEATLAQRTMEREAAERRAKESNEKYKKAKAKLEEDLTRERETTEEMEALNALCQQLSAWRDETESDLTVSQRMSDKMRMEKQALAAEKRQLDIYLFSLSNEVWKLESKLEMFKKQLEIKNTEMEKVNDRVTAYAAELEDLELDKRRLVSLWNSVIVNITQRDKVYDSVRDDYKTLQDNYRTLLNSLDITKKVVMEEMNKGKEIAMNRDKLNYDIEHAMKLHDTEDIKRQNLEAQISQLTESIEMTERDQEMIRVENQTTRNILKSTGKELERKAEYKLKLENEILLNLQDCLLNDKAVETMANGIRKMREMSRKQEISLMSMENQHAHIMLDIEVMRNRQAKNQVVLEESQAMVKEKEKEIDVLQNEHNHQLSVMTRKQRELDIIMKKYITLKEIFDMKSPQERRIEGLEKQIKCLRERTEVMQHEWLRQQGHVVKLADHHHMMVTEINLIAKQIQICDQKIMRIQAESEAVALERSRVERSLRTLRGRLQVLEHTRKDATERNQGAQRANLAISHEYAANLKERREEETLNHYGQRKVLKLAPFSFSRHEDDGTNEKQGQRRPWRNDGGKERTHGALAVGTSQSNIPSIKTQARFSKADLIDAASTKGSRRPKSCLACSRRASSLITASGSKS
uniref:Coiled-coil domain-containing protein 39 n=1 Tax=Heliothis virescens TaxID=7102 RepID=A0A2A4JTB2_HELVI